MAELPICWMQRTTQSRQLVYWLKLTVLSLLQNSVWKSILNFHSIVRQREIKKMPDSRSSHWPDLDLLFLLRSRKLFGVARCWKISAGRRQWQTDEQPPAGDGQTAAHGLTPVVLHMQVWLSIFTLYKGQNDLIHVYMSDKWLKYK